MRELKDSGVEWIGKIPCHWRTAEIKVYCQSIYAGGTPQTNNMEYWDGDIPWLPSGVCHDCKIYKAPKYITRMGFDNSSTKHIPANTALVAMTGATCGNTGYLTFDACANQSVVAYVPKKGTYSLFLWYLLRASKENLLTYQTGGAQGGVNVENCKNIVVPYVPFEEQLRIADYLEDKCSKIDDILEKQQTIIEKLREYKISSITEAVTKGIDTNVETQNCTNGIIERIPKHWNQAKLGVGIAILQTGPFGSQLHADEYVEDGYAFLINPANIQDGKISADRKCTVSYEKANSLSQHIMDVGDIVFARRGEMGRCACIEDEKNKYFCGTGSIRLKCNDMLNYKYANYYLQTSYIKQYLELKAVGTTMANLNSSIIAGIPMVYPPIDEQERIVDFIEKKIKAIDKQIMERELLLEKMCLYRQAIIYEVVTGKKEV